MKVILALVSAAGVAGLMLSSSAEAACTYVKADPNCWGDTCRMVCKVLPYGGYRPGMSTSRTQAGCGPCVRGVRICTYHVGGTTRTIGRRC